MMPSPLNPLAIRGRLRRDDYAAPYPLGGDSWVFDNFDGDRRIIVSHDPLAQPGVDWIHASISQRKQMPTYADLKRMHDAVFRDGWAYQVFAPPSDHINIHDFCLHLFGRLDGQPVLPDFTDGTGSI